MLGHYLLTLYRSLSRHRLYAAINVLGLAVGIAVFLVLFLEVRFETSFERWIPGAQHLYVTRTSGGPFPPMIYSEGALLDDLRHDFPRLEGARASLIGAHILQGDHVNVETVYRVDPNFLQLINLPAAAGQTVGALDRPDNILISERKAKLYFGDANPVGRQINLRFGDADHAYRVAAVLKDPPAATDREFSFDMLVPLTPQMKAAAPNWRGKLSLQVVTVLKLTTPVEVQAINQDITRLLSPDASDPKEEWPMFPHFHTIPLPALHLAPPAAAARVAAFGAVGLLTLLLAAVNYVNLATARAAVRAREVALRKVMGATSGALMVQFMAEAFAMAALSALIGLALCELTLPLVNAAGGLSLKMAYLGDETILPIVLGVVLAVGFGAGVYPAIILARFQPALVLASVRTPGGGRAASRVREGLVVVQFTIAIAFTLAATVIVSQMAYLRRADLGFRREGLLVSTNFHNENVSAAQRANVLTAWRSLPGVVGATMADMAPGGDGPIHVMAGANPMHPSQTLSTYEVTVGPDFFRVYGVRLVAGRLLDPAHGGDFTVSPALGPGASEAEQKAANKALAAQPRPNVVINMSAARQLGYPNVRNFLGRRIDTNDSDPTIPTIVGVIQDIRLRDPHEPIPPTMYLGQGGDIFSANAVVRYSDADPRAVLALMRVAWRRIVPNVPFDAAPDQTTLETYYRADDRNGRLLTIVSALAVLIGCVGLYGLASFNTARRVKEIGIRKTLGASTTDILKLLIGQFLRPVILANLFAWPLAWWAMNGYLSGFDQRIALTPAYFLAATALTLLIAVATVGGQAYAVARAEPAKALRHE
jgi:putative ABC transport system permease protein